jgi:2,3-bisphosphoglycerate-independent phosphoglycerate mutase
VKAVETVDAELKRVIEALEKKGGVAIVTADHGNAELNVDPMTGEKHTAHTLFPVPCIITDKERALHDGGLADLAPTILELLGLKKAAQMSGRSLLK